jgi:peptidoglycan/LPS O-acetylase OafA/YrhL
MAILPVLALHLKPLLPLPAPAYRWGWDHLQRNGSYGVSMFFLISGFLISRIIDSMPNGLFEAGWKEFYARRTGRIIPLFLLAIFLGVFFFCVLRGGSPAAIYCFKLPVNPLDSLFWISIFFFTFNWAKSFWMGAWQGLGLHWVVFWSLAVEEQFYLFYPWVLRWLGNEKRLIRFLILVILSGFGWRWLLFIGLFPNGVELKWGSFGFFDQIALGVLLYIFQKRHGKSLSRDRLKSFGLALLGFFMILLVYLGTFSEEDLDWVYGPFLIALGLFAFLLGGLNLPVFESRFWTILTFPGKYSYGNYLFHVSVLYFLNSFLAGLNVFAAFLFFVVASTVVSAFSFHFFEVPANRWVRGLLGKPHP